MRLLPSALMILCLSLFCFTQTKLLRFPDIYGDRVVFTYGRDLWTASAGGGTATRLTAHPGMETYAKFSPDGKWIAFTGQYDGDEQANTLYIYDLATNDALKISDGPRAAEFRNPKI